MAVAGFQKLLTRIAAEAEFPFPVHPRMLRHACGFKLAHDRHDTRAIQVQRIKPRRQGTLERRGDRNTGVESGKLGRTVIGGGAELEHGLRAR